jgi:hypothetical protein
MNTVAVDFSGIGVRIGGLADDLAVRLEADWAPFLADEQDSPFLRVEVSLRKETAVAGPFRPKRMRANLKAGSAHFGMPEGDADVTEGGTASVRLLRGPGPTVYFAMMNLLRACLAWRLPSRGAAMLHAAGLAIDGRAFLLVGPEASGKSTWARSGEERGARVLSDDLVLVECLAGGAEALGGPFRSTHRTDYRPGRWPIAAILFPRWGPHAAWAPCDRLRARAGIAANLPFIVTAIERDERVAAVVERLAATVPCKELTFAPDASFVDLLRSDGSRHG